MITLKPHHIRRLFHSKNWALFEKIMAEVQPTIDRKKAIESRISEYIGEELKFTTETAKYLAS